MFKIMQSGNQTDPSYIIKQFLKIVHLGNQAEVLTNELIFNKMHSGIQADLLTNELNIQDNAVRETGITSN